jgi:group II intron reverse transcriptase/maturase
MRKSEPNPESGNPTGPSAGEGANPVSKRAAIAAKARKNPKERFNNLLHHLTYELVAECLQEIPQTSAAGVDGMSVKQASENLSWLLPPILKQIHEGRYTPPPVRRVYIPKADGWQRPIGVPAVIDRAIQAAMVKILNEIYEQDFLKCSFGFRPGLSCHHALATINEILYRRKMEHVLEVDIRDFFGSLSHEWLMRFLELRIGDRRVLMLIKAWLKAGVLEQGRWQEVEKGTPQGGSVSPLLANIYHLSPLCRGPLVRTKDQTAVEWQGGTGPLRG